MCSAAVVLADYVQSHLLLGLDKSALSVCGARVKVLKFDAEVTPGTLARIRFCWLLVVVCCLLVVGCCLLFVCLFVCLLV